MRPICFASAAILFAAASLPGQQDEASLGPRTVVELAVKALGLDLDAPERPSTWSERGVFHSGGGEMPYTARWVFQAPNRYRFDMTATVQEQDFKLAAAIDGSAAWESALGSTRSVEGKKFDYMKHEAYQIWLVSLLPLLADPAFKLSPVLPPVEIDGQECLGVLVKRDGRRDVTLHFDRKTRLLARLTTTNLDEFQDWKEVKEEAFFTDYRDVDGLQCCHRLRVMRDGKLLLDSTLSGHKLLDKLDPKTFQRPGGEKDG